MQTLQTIPAGCKLRVYPRKPLPRKSPGYYSAPVYTLPAGAWDKNDHPTHTGRFYVCPPESVIMTGLL